MAEHHLVIPDTVQARWDTVVAGRTVIVIQHFLVPIGAVTTPAVASALFDSLKALWSTNLASLCPPTTSFVVCHLRDLRSAGMAIVSSTTGSVAGTAPAGEAMPRQIAACLTLRTNRAGKSFRGRSYFGGFGENANSADNHMTAAAKTGLDAFAAGYIAAVNLNGWQLSVAHRPTVFDETTGLPVAPGLGFSTPVTQVTCRDNIWDTQRRRAA